jgi:hypothetical protein
MSEQFDDELSKHITDVFDQYEDTAPAEEGWLLLRQKFPPQKKRRIIPIWWSVAATLFIATLFGLWFYHMPQQPKSTLVKTTVRKQTTDTVIKNRSNSAADQSHPAVKEESVNKAEYAANGHKIPTHKPSSNVFEQKSNYSPSVVADHPKTTLSIIEGQPVVALNLAQNKGDASTINLGDQPADNRSVSEKANVTSTATVNNAAIAQNVDSAQHIKSSFTARQRNKQSLKTNTSPHSDSAIINKNSGLERLLAAEQRVEKDQKTKKSSPSVDKKVLFNIYAATYFNYAEGSKTQFNTGAGLSTDIRLSKNFKLSTGVAIGKNTLDYNRQPTSAGILSDAISAAPIASDVNANYSNTTLGIVPLRVANTPAVSAYNVSLTGLDIPLNIKYELNPSKNDSYISAGLSSGTFITENYTYRYDNTPNAFGVSGNLPDATTRRSFSRFDFARTLNLSIGMGYQISKQNRLVIEPFLKYPLSGLGSEQIKFGAGGLNLRFKFQ